MSFFARLGSDSDSDSSGSESEESILSGDEGEEQDKRIASKPAKNNKASAFLRSDAEDSDEDDSDSDDDDDDLSEGGSDVQRQVRIRSGKQMWCFGTRKERKADVTIVNGQQILEGCCLK